MNICESHILENLDSFISRESERFDLIFKKLTNTNKEQFRDFLIYVDNLINEVTKQDSSGLNYAHIHLPHFEHATAILLEFLLVKFYLKSARKVEIPEDNSYINHHLEKIEVELDLPIQLASNTTNREFIKKKERKTSLRKLKRVFLELQALDVDSVISSYHPKCLINVLTKDKNNLINSLLPSSPYYMTEEDRNQNDLLKPLSYVLINDGQTIDQLDENPFVNEKYLSDTIEDVILFDCNSKTTNREFSHSNLKEFNTEGSKFKNLIVLSFDRNVLRLGRLIPQLSTISARYFQRPSGLNLETYTCLPCEVNSLLNQPRPLSAKPTFIGEQSFVWQNFQQYVYEYEELSELISIKMRNVYGLCFSHAYKELVLSDLFSNKDKGSTLLSAGTKVQLLGLDDEVSRELKTMLEAVLQLVLDLGNSNIMEVQRKKGKYHIILPYKVFHNKNLLNQTHERFKYLGNVTFTTWRDIDPVCKGHILILDYRDSGRFPYSISPSLFEHSFPKAMSIEAPLIATFFKYNYDYTFFDYHKSLYQKILQHPVRDKYFQWNQLIDKLHKLRPAKSESEYLWDLDNTYSNFVDRETITIKFEAGAKKSYYHSQLFIAKAMDDDELFSVKAENIPDQISDQNLSIQLIDELYEGLNLFKTTQEEEQEIEQLKKSYNLPKGEQENRLWKIQLKRKVDESDAAKVYAELKECLEQQKLTIVSEDYFLNHWVVSQSNMLIPRSKRVFKTVCDYLKLPQVYFRVLLKKRANERLASRQSTSKMNRLIAELIDLGMFHRDMPEASFGMSFLEKHDLEEAGFNEEHLNNEVRALVDLLKPSLNLMIVEHAKLKTS